MLPNNIGPSGKKMGQHLIFCVLLAVLLLGAACATRTAEPSAFGGDRPSLEARSLQTRTFSAASKTQLLHSVLEVLQENNFIVDKVSPTSGVVTATRFEAGSIRASITLKNVSHSSGVKDKKAEVDGKLASFSVRLNIFAHDGSLISEPEEYQTFFAALSRRLSLSTDK